MDIKSDFVFGTQEGTNNQAAAARAAAAAPADPLAPLRGLIGRWVGHGFNQIWRPFHDTTGGAQDRFLELNRTEEDLEFKEIPGLIPNRGFLQDDILDIRGVSYLQQIKDINDPAKPGIHLEPGLWISVRKTTNPAEPATVTRMASIPHGTTINAQGPHIPLIMGPPIIKPVDITPFTIGNPASLITFPESTLTTGTQFRTPPALMTGITQTMVDNPNSVLVSALAGQTVLSTQVLSISSATGPGTVPDVGGGDRNIAFLLGKPPGGPNARAAKVTATFWIERIKGANGAPDFDQLQYTQTVLLDFATLSWPHVSVATLRRAP